MEWNTKTYTVTLEDGTRFQVREGSNLLDLLRGEERAPEAPCGGQGTCKKCKVLVNGTEVLACRTTVDRDMQVVIPQKAKTRVLTGGMSVEAEMDPCKGGYLIAIDIGTTTVACFLMDGTTGKELATAGLLNPQAPFGADVISRIQSAMGGTLGAQRDAVRGGMEKLIAEVCGTAGISPSEVGVVSVVGNPTMQQLFMGIPVENLATVPFAPALTKTKLVSAKDYLPLCPNAVLQVIPDISGYVGADTVGCVVSTGMDRETPVTLMVDIGTNGEMVLGNRDRMMACSTAAGPALEGAKIHFGMRGAPGAIDHVRLENGKLSCTVIGGGKANGICGSGLIDAVAVMLETGVINERGRIQTAETVPAFGEFLYEVNGERVFELRDGIYLTQQDIREVQLAKGAIAAGVRLMAEQLGLTMEDVRRVLLAGAFGSFMDPENACKIGLLPRELSGKITAVGNAAGAGAKIMACDKKEFRRTDEIVERIDFIELAALEEFEMAFAMGMSFAEDDE